MKIAELRGPHKGGERVKDSVVRLMRTIVHVPSLGRNGKAATSLIPILSDTTVSDDDDDPTGEVTFSFSKKMREVIGGSTHWGRVRAEVMFAFSSKYALALYEIISLRINLEHKWQDIFDLADFRALLGVPEGKLDRTPNLIKWAVQPAETEVNALADFGVKIEPMRRGGPIRGEVVGFRVSWWRKDIPELKKAFAELNRPKLGRRSRISGGTETIAEEP